MTTTYADELRTRLEAATRSTDDHDRDATIKALTDAERHPRAAAECVVPIVDLFAETVGTSTASRLVEPILAAGTGSVRDRALAALDAVADVRPEAIGRVGAVVRLLKTVDRVPPAEQRQVLSIVGRCGPYADDDTVDGPLVEMIEPLVASGAWDPEVGPAAVDALGGIVAAGSPAERRVLDVLETVLDDGDVTAAAAVGRAAGRALTGAAPPVEPLATFLDRLVTRNDVDARAGAAVGACRALSGESDARATGRDVVERLLCASDPAARETVPRAIGELVGSATTTGCDASIRYLRGALADPATTVRTAAVEAAAEAVVDRRNADAPAPERFLRLLVGTVVEGAGDTGETERAAVRELARDDVADAFVSAAVPERKRLVRAIEGVIVDQQRAPVAAKAIDLLATLLDGRIDRGREETTADEDEEDGESDREDGPDRDAVMGSDQDVTSEVPKAAEQLAADREPAALGDAFAGAGTERRRLVVVRAVDRQFRRDSLDDRAVDALVGTLQEAWAVGTVPVREATVEAVVTGAACGHVAWDDTEQLLRAAGDADRPAVRATATDALDRLLRAGVADWANLGSFIESSLGDEMIHVRRRAVAAVGRSLRGGALGWSTAAPVVRDARVDDADTVATAAIDVVHDALLGGRVAWADVATLLQPRLSDSPAVVEACVEAVRAGVRAGNADGEHAVDLLETVRSERAESVETAANAVAVVGVGFEAGTLEWATGVDLLDRALREGPDPVAMAAVKATAVALQEGAAAWSAVDPLLTRAAVVDAVDVAETSVRAAGVALQVGRVEWDDVTSFLERARLVGAAPVAVMAVRAVGAGLTEATVEWTAVNSFLKRAATGEDTAAAEAAVRAVGHGLREGTVTWSDAVTLLDRVPEEAPPEVAEAAVEAIGDALTDGPLQWEQVVEFLGRVRRSESSAVTEAIVRVAGDYLVAGAIDWATVREIFGDSRLAQSEDGKALETATRAVADALLEGTVEWSAVERFLDRSRRVGDETAAVTAVEAVGGALQEGRVQWADAAEVLGSALAATDTAVAREAAKAGGVALQEGHVDWPAVERFFQRAIEHDDPGVATAALRSIGYCVQQGTLGWDAVGPFVEAASVDDRVPVVHEAVRIVGAGLQNGHLTWTDVDAVLNWAVRIDAAPVAAMAVRTVGLGLERHTVDWVDAAPVIDDALGHQSPNVVETALRATVDAVRADMLAWGDAIGRVTAAVEDGSDTVGTAAVRAAGDLLGEDGQPWTAVAPVFGRARREGSPAVATEAVETVRDAVQRGDLAWAAAATFLAVTRWTGPEPAAREAVAAVGDAFAAGTLAWEELEATLTPTGISDWPIDRSVAAEATVEALDAALDTSHAPARRVADLAADLHDEVTAAGEPLARVAVDALVDGLVGSGDLDPLLASLIDGGGRTRLVTLAGEFVRVRTNGTASEGAAVLDTGVRDGNGGVRGFAVRVLEEGVATGTAPGTGTELCDRLRTCFERDAACRRGAPHVRTRIVRLAAYAINRQAGPTDRLRALLLDAAADGTPAVRRSAIERLAATYDVGRHDSGRDDDTDVDDLVDAVVDAGKADCVPVREIAVEAAGDLITSDHPLSGESRDRLEATLSNGVIDHDPAVCWAAASAVATVQRHTEECSVSTPTGIRRALGQFEFPAATRLALVELLVGTTTPVDLDAHGTR
jgi:hypothetical protein